MEPRTNSWRPIHGRVTPTMLLALLSLGTGKLVAQQPFHPAQGWAQNDPYSQQYPQPTPEYSPDPYQAQPQNTPPLQYGQPQSYPTQPYPDSNQQYPQQDYAPQQSSVQPLNTEQLEQLVAPVALYPDTLVAQILAAATYPAQVVDSDHWRQSIGYASPDQIVAGANAQNWDPSLKALTAFPQVLAEMDQNLRWTISLGNAYYNQPQDVLDVIQIMRQRAQAAGNLQSSPQESVSYDQGFIQVAPANPQVVYLPAYDPWSVYGQPVQPYRGFSLVGALGSFFGSSFGSGFGSGAIRYGLGIAMSAFSNSSFGWLGWGLNWLTHSLLFHNSNYYSHSSTVADWGLPHGGPRARYATQRSSMAFHAPNSTYRPQNRPQAGPQNGPQYGMNRAGGEFRNPGNYNSYNRSPESTYTRSADRFSESRPSQSYSRGNPYAGSNYARPPMMAYNRIEPQASRPQQPYSRPGFGYETGSGYRGAPTGNYGSRPAPAYSVPQQAYRAPASGFQRGDFAERSSGSYGGRGFEGYSGRQEKSGGFHPFGGGHMHEPKAPKPPKDSSHGHSERGGHFGGRHHR